MSALTVNIASHLPAMAERQPHTLAVVFPEGRDRRGRVSYTHYTFRQLEEESNALARGLEHHGIGRGVRTVLMVKPSLDFFALTFALFKVGAVPVLVDPGIGMRNLGQCLAEAEPAAFIGIPQAHAARLLLGWGRKTVRINVTVGGSWALPGVGLQAVRRAGEGAGGRYEMAPTRPDDTAAILFTSGSTGVPKGAVYSHGNFTAQVEAIRTVYGIQPGEIDLPTFPLFALFAPALGMSAIIPDMDATRPAAVDPAKIVEAIGNFGVTTMFGSPALINRVGRYGVARGIKLPTLRRAISAGAPVPAAVLERFAKLLAPGVQVFTPYGATESLPVCSIGSDEILGETARAAAAGKGVCVGRPVAGIELAIIRVTDTPLPTWSDDLRVAPGEIGEIAVKGPVVTREYFGRPESTALAKIADPRGAGGGDAGAAGSDGSGGGGGGFWHRMGDVGYLDGRGRVWFCGRKSQRVVTPAETLFTIPCEAVFNAHPRVFRSALVGVDSGCGIEPVLCVELEKDGGAAPDREALRRELLALGAAQRHTRAIAQVLFHPAFPVDIRHNAKIGREQLAAWAAAELRAAANGSG